MKKILYIIDHDIRQLGGSQLSTITIINEMIKSNNEPALLMVTNSNMQNEEIFDNKCKIYSMGERNGISRIRYS